MNYCINPECKQRQNPDSLDYCQSCVTSLLINNRYRLIKPLRPLNIKSSTEIFEAADGATHKVIKILKQNSANLVNLLEQEATILQLLNHPGIPQVDFDGYFTFIPNDSSSTLHCLVMEKIEGQNLEDWLKQNGIISQAQALKWLRELLEILDYVHQNGFFHRDIKPSNIIRKPNDKLALIDFGAAREITDTYLVKIGTNVLDELGKSITIIISPGYTPLEQINGRAVPQSDFYALGRTFVRLLTGKSLDEFPIDKTGQLIWRDKAPQISQPLADFIDDLMAPFPGERPKNAQIALQGIKASNMFFQHILRLFGSPKTRRRMGVFAVMILITGFGAYWLSFLLQVRYYSSRGREALQSQDWDEARKNFEEAIARNPNNSIFHSDLGLACSEQKDFDCAKNQYQKALNLNPDPETAASIQYSLGDLYEKLKQFDEAIKQYQIAMQYNGEIGVYATNNLARLQILQNREYDLAISNIRKVLDRAKYPGAKSTLYKNLGWAYFQKGDYRNARKYLQAAISLDEDKSAAPHCLLAQVKQAQGDKVEVKASWKNCRDYDSQDLPEVNTWQLDADLYLKTER